MEHTTDDCNCKGKQCTKCEFTLCKGHYNKQKGGKQGLRSTCRDCDKKANAKWREENAEYNRQRVREYHAAHKEEDHKRNTEWRQKNLEYDKERHKQYRQENTEKIREYGKEYRTKNRPAIRERERIYWEKNKEKQDEKNRRYRETHRKEIAERSRNYRRANIDKVRERERLYRRVHFKERRAYIDQWRAERRKSKPINLHPPKPRAIPQNHSNIETTQDTQRSYYARNKEYLQGKWGKYYEENKEYLNQRSAQWLKDNPRKHAARQAKRRTLKTQAGGSYTAIEFEALCEMYNNTCLRCGRSDVKLTADHIMPISMGGSSDISNIQPLCFSCNSSKGAKFIDFRPQNT